MNASTGIMLGVSLVAMIVIMICLWRVMQAEEAYLRSLPSFDEAKESFTQQYPEYASCLKIQREEHWMYVDSGSHWYPSNSHWVYTYYAVCSEVGFRVRIQQPESAMK